MASTYELIASQTLGSDTAGVAFSSIPQTYDDLVLLVSARGSDTGSIVDNVTVEFNSDNGTNYDVRILYGTGSTAASTGSVNQTRLFYLYMTTELATASTFGNGELYISNYAGSSYKSVSISSVTENNATAAYMSAATGLWRSTSAITYIVLYPFSSANFKTGSSFYLYGVTHA